MDEMGEWVAENTLWPARRRALQRELDGRVAAGQRIVIVSGMFAPILTAVAARFGYEAIGTPLIYDDGIFSGESGELNIQEHKAEAVRLFPVVACAYGDTAADIPMLRAAAAAVAVHPDPTLRAAALEAGWRIFETQSA
jgi:phosphoserine phosphatase